MPSWFNLNPHASPPEVNSATPEPATHPLIIPEIKLGDFPPHEFDTFDELYEFVANNAALNGWSVSIYNPTRSKLGILRAANLR